MSKKETIQHLTDLMSVIHNAYYKGRLGERNGENVGGDGVVVGDLWVHESPDCGISIDLYHFGGDGKDVCEGLHDCTITFDDGTTDTGWVFCMHYEPDDVTPLVFLLSPDKGDDYDTEPESLPAAVLENIVKWLESQFKTSNG